MATNIQIRTRTIGGVLYVDAIDLANWLEATRNEFENVPRANPDKVAGAKIVIDMVTNWVRNINV